MGKIFIAKGIKSNIFQLPSCEASYVLRGMMCQPRHVLSILYFSAYPSYKLHSYKKKKM